MDAFRRKVDDEFGWQNKRLSAKWPLFRAAVQTVLLLLDSCADDGRSELLHTKLMTLVLGEKYRAHGDVLFVYCQGAWQAPGLGCLNAQDLEFLAQALRHAQAYFWAFSRHKVYRKFSQVAWELKVLLAIPDEEPLMEWQLCDVMSQKPEHKTKSWSLGLSELCRDLRKQVCDRSKGLIRAFLRWSDSSVEAIKRKPGIAFADCRFLSCVCFKSATERRDRLTRNSSSQCLFNRLCRLYVHARRAIAAKAKRSSALLLHLCSGRNHVCCTRSPSTEACGLAPVFLCRYGWIEAAFVPNSPSHRTIAAA